MQAGAAGRKAGAGCCGPYNMQAGRQSVGHHAGAAGRQSVAHHDPGALGIVMQAGGNGEERTGRR